MGSIRAIRFGNFSIRDYVDAIRETEPERCALFSNHNVPNGNQDLEESELEESRQHENEPEDASESDLEDIWQHESEPEDASASQLEGLKQHENEPEGASAAELEGLKQHENEPEDASDSEPEGLKQPENEPEDAYASELEGLKQHDNKPEDAPEIIIISDSDDDTSRTVSDLPVGFVKSQCSNDRTVNEGASNENCIPAATDLPGFYAEIIIISDSDDDTSRTVSDLPVGFVKSQCSNDRTVNEGASNENCIPAATDDGSLRRKLKKIRRKLKKIRNSKKIKKLKKIKKGRSRLLVDIYKELDEREAKSDVLSAPKSNSDGHAGPSAPESNSDGHAGPSALKSNSDGHAGPSTPISNSDGHAGPSGPSAPKSNSDGHAGPSAPKSNSDGHAGPSAPKCNSDGHAGPSAPKSNSDGHVGPSAPKSNSDGHVGPSASKSNSDGHAGPSAQLAIEWRNDSDDVILNSLRKRKAAHRIHNKKQKALKAKEPKLDESETSNHGPKGLNSHGPFATGKPQEANCSGSGACDGLGGSEPSGSVSVVGRLVATAGELNASTGPEVDAARAVEREVLVCSLNQNPADFLMSFESGYFRTL